MSPLSRDLFLPYFLMSIQPRYFIVPSVLKRHREFFLNLIHALYSDKKSLGPLDVFPIRDYYGV